MSDRCWARANPIGMLTRPKLMDPFQIVRMGPLSNCSRTALFLPSAAIPSRVRFSRDLGVALAHGGRAHRRRADGTGALALCPRRAADTAGLPRRGGGRLARAALGG